MFSRGFILDRIDAKNCIIRLRHHLLFCHILTLKVVFQTPKIVQLRTYQGIFPMVRLGLQQSQTSDLDPRPYSIPAAAPDCE
jgi:hypothetical protein